MTFMVQVIKEQIHNLNLIFRLSIYEIKSKYLLHYLGVFWEFLNPTIQLLVYWLVFGLGIRGGSGDIDGVPYFVWLLTGLTPWFFINRSINQGSNSVFRKISLVSKMKFPVSVLPTIAILSSGFIFIIMSIIMFIILYFSYGINVQIELLQLPYYIFSMLVFLFAITLLFSTISVIVRDFQSLLQQGTRILFYLSPILWDPKAFPEFIQSILKLNPFYYLVSGFRNSILGREWFFQDIMYTVYFWSLTLLILLIGSTIHVKLRSRFVDYI